MSEAWSTTDLGAGLAISNAGRTATSSTASDTLGRGTVSAASGKKYFEGVTSNAATDFIGFANASAATNAILGVGGNANSIGLRGSNGIRCAGTDANDGTFSPGDRIALAFDIDHFIFWWKDLTTASAWFPSGDPNLGTGGFTSSSNPSFKPADFPGPYFPAYSFSRNGDTNTAYFAAADIIGAIPTGFSLLDDAALAVGAYATMTPIPRFEPFAIECY